MFCLSVPATRRDQRTENLLEIVAPHLHFASTVNYHLYNAMQKLEVINRPQAVAAAVRLGLIEID
jgi:hypothetical protein